MEKILLEICCGSAEDAVLAAGAGADRVELCSALPLGGLTPSLGELQVAARQGIPVMALLRPREGGFCYSETEFETVLRDAEAALRHGASGLVFGFLHADGSVDEGRCAKVCALAGERERVFHRAIDAVPDWRAALDCLIRLRFTRVLTSGQAASAPEGAETIRAMREYAAGRIQVLPGGGVKAGNARLLLRRTGCSQLHASLKALRHDPSADGNSAIRFNGMPPREGDYTLCDGSEVRRMRALLDGERLSL